MNNKSLSSVFLAVILMCSLILVGAIRFGTAQSSTSTEPLFNISGYILDSNGNGIGGANIIFNVLQIVPSVYSDSSGHYEISAPAGTYHVNVWPQFDSNYIYYDEPSFVVESDMTKNITLYSGCKVSGYISDSSGTPVTGAVVLLRNFVNTFGSGWFSNYLGYYFLSVPAGTYTIDAHPRTGYNYSGPTTDFPTYYEYNFVVNGNLAKNITVDGSSPTPSPSPTSNFISNSDSWPMFHNDPAHSGYSESTGPLTNQILWKYQAGSGIESSPAVVGGVVYFGALWNGRNGFVYALNASTGSKIWQYATDSGVESSPAVVGGVVYIGSYGGYVYALNAASGSKIWAFNAGGSVFPSPAVVGGKVYVGSATGDLYALNAATGSPLWSHHTGGAISSSPAVVDGVVYFGSQDQNIYALRASDGSEIWHYTTGSFVDTSPAVVGGIVYFGSRDGYVYALNAASGSKIWSFHSPRTPITGRSYYYSTPAVANGVVYFGMYDSYIYALNAANGNLVWEFQTGNYVFSSPVVAGGVVYVGSFDKNVYALNAVTGSKIWSYQTGDQMRSSAAVANGVVYVGSGDGYLYAFSSSNQSTTTNPNLESTSTLSPEPQVSVRGTTVTDDFSADSGAWQYLGSASRDQKNQYLVLTTSDNQQGGVALFKAPIQGSFTANFSYKAGGGSYQGDGFTIFFYKQKYSTIGLGGSLGFTTHNNEIVPGYGIEFDGWQNIPQDFQQFVGGQINPPQGDPSSDHIALIEGYVGNHLTYVNDARIADNNWHQVAVEVQGSSVKVFVDQGLVLQWTGVLDRTYDGFGFSGANGQVGSNWHIIDDFSITAHNLQKSSLTVSCRSSISYSGFNVQIDGYVTLNGTGISDAPILLSYSVTGGKSWEDLTLVYTGSDGSYSATWLPSVTGNYLIKATYEGDADTLGASSEIVNFAVTNFAEKNLLFSVSSNSTVTSLSFNSTTSELSFTVSGPSETTGYVKVAIAKSLVSNAENIKVYLDGNQLNYEVTSNEDSWLLTFTYKHSTHQVMISLAANAGGTTFLGIDPWVLIASAIVVGAGLLIYLVKRK